MLKILKKIKNVQTLQNNSSNPLEEIENVQGIKMSNMNCSSARQQHRLTKHHKNNENYYQTLIQLVRDTYPKNFHSPHYQMDTMVANQTKTYRGYHKHNLNMTWPESGKPQTSVPLKSCATYDKFNVKNLTNTHKFINTKIVQTDKVDFMNKISIGTSTCDLNKNRYLKPILKNESHNLIEHFMDSLEKYRAYYNNIPAKISSCDSKSIKLMPLHKKPSRIPIRCVRKIIPTTSVENSVCKNTAVRLTNPSMPFDKLSSKKQRFCTSKKSDDVLTTNIRNVLMHSIDLLLNTPSMPKVFGKYLHFFFFSIEANFLY